MSLKPLWIGKNRSFLVPIAGFIYIIEKSLDL